MLKLPNRIFQRGAKNMHSMVKLAAAAALSLGAFSANAASISQDFSTPVYLGLNAVSADVTGSINNVRRSPWQGTGGTNEADNAYTSVAANASILYGFGAQYDVATLLWGSPDSYNTLEFLLGGLVVDTVIGSDLFPDAQKGLGATTVTVTDNAGGAFDAMRMLSTGGRAAAAVGRWPDGAGAPPHQGLRPGAVIEEKGPVRGGRPLCHARGAVRGGGPPRAPTDPRWQGGR